MLTSRGTSSTPSMLSRTQIPSSTVTKVPNSPYA